MKSKPKPKYDLTTYQFGTIFARHFIEETLGESYWQYEVLRVGNGFRFWYAEEELDALLKAPKASII